MNPQNSTASAIDPNALILTKAIAMQEGKGQINYNAVGDGGTSAGAYQWNNGKIPVVPGQVPANFKADAVAAGLDPTDFSPANQNQVAYTKVSNWLKAGYKAPQIASMWNAGHGEPDAYTGKFSNGSASSTPTFDVPGYVQGVQKYATQLWEQQQAPSQPPMNPLGVSVAEASTGATTAPASENSATFPSSPTDSPLVSGLKTLGNVPGSALGFAGNALSALNPVNILNNIGQIGSGFSILAQQEGVGKALMDVLAGTPKATLDTLVPQGVRAAVSGAAGTITGNKIGNSADLATAQKLITNDPVGQIAPVILGTEMAAKGADALTGTKVAPAIDNAISSVGGTGADIINKGVSIAAKPIGSAVDLAGQLTRSVASHLTALSPETISQILTTPEAFSKIAQDESNRGSVFDDVKNGLNTLQSAYGETGNLYKAARASAETVTVPENFISDALAQHGIQLTTDATTGKQTVAADTNSLTRNPADITALQNFVDNWGNKTTLTPNEFLNMRGDIQKIAKFGKDVGTNRDAAAVAKTLYADANKTMRPQVRGLKPLDETASPQIDLIKKVKKDLMNADGTFKDNAPSKIANSLNKEGLLSRLEKLSPGISKRLQVLGAVEDIEKAKGLKVASYGRSALEGGALITGHLGLLVGAIISNPAIAVPLIRGAGLTAAQIGNLVGILKVVGGHIGSAINNAPVSVIGATTASGAANASASNQ